MKKGKIFTWAGVILIAAALLLTGYNLWDSRRAGKASDNVLEQLTAVISASPAANYPYSYAKIVAGTATLLPMDPEQGQTQQAASGQKQGGSATSDDVLLPGEETFISPDQILYPDYMLNPSMEMPVTEIDGLGYIGVLNLPTLNLVLPIAGEWSYPNLKIAPCRYSGSAYQNDMVIAAHNYWMQFGALPNLKIGDPVLFTDVDGNEFCYSVAEVENLQPTQIEEMTDSGYPLTLFTCTVGGRMRLAIRCDVF